MHKDFYASGFLFHSTTQQILLQQHTSLSVSSPWQLFGGTYLESEGPETIFKSVILKLLDIKIDIVHPIYSYLNENIDKNHSVLYAKVRKLQNFSPKNGM